MKPSSIFIILGKGLIVLFCIWHAVAIAVYTFPVQATGVIVDTLRTRVTPIVQPYLLLTSQWQMWELFSPDPMRRISRYRIDARTVEYGWQTLKVLDAKTTSFGFADDFSYLQQMEEPGEGKEELRARVLASFCKPLGLPEGAFVALIVEYLIIPDTVPEGGWKEWQRTVRGNWYWWVAAILPCPSPDDPSVIPVSYF